MKSDGLMLISINYYWSMLQNVSHRETHFFMGDFSENCLIISR